MCRWLRALAPRQPTRLGRSSAPRCHKRQKKKNTLRVAKGSAILLERQWCCGCQEMCRLWVIRDFCDVMSPGPLLVAYSKGGGGGARLRWEIFGGCESTAGLDTLRMTFPALAQLEAALLLHCIGPGLASFYVLEILRHAPKQGMLVPTFESQVFTRSEVAIKWPGR